MEAEVGSGRVVRSYRQTIEAEPGRVFPLLCPVREAEWLDGWTFQMIYSASGVVEAGAVFATSAPDEPDTVWVVSRHDPARHRVEFCRFTPGSRTCLLRIAVQALTAGRSAVDVSYEHTSIAPAGDRYLAEWTGDAFLAAMEWWERSMNHFLATGSKLVRAASA